MNKIWSSHELLLLLYSEVFDLLKFHIGFSCLYSELKLICKFPFAMLLLSFVIKIHVVGTICCLLSHHHVLLIPFLRNTLNILPFLIKEENLTSYWLELGYMPSLAAKVAGKLSILSDIFNPLNAWKCLYFYMLWEFTYCFSNFLLPCFEISQ